MNVVLTILKREISCSRSAEGQQEECATGEVDNRRTAGGVEDMVRSRGQREENLKFKLLAIIIFCHCLSKLIVIRDYIK